MLVAYFIEDSGGLRGETASPVKADGKTATPDLHFISHRPEPQEQYGGSDLAVHAGACKSQL